jgi:hypothetical protein
MNLSPAIRVPQRAIPFAIGALFSTPVIRAAFLANSHASVENGVDAAKRGASSMMTHEITQKNLERMP